MYQREAEVVLVVVMVVGAGTSIFNILPLHTHTLVQSHRYTHMLTPIRLTEP